MSFSGGPTVAVTWTVPRVILVAVAVTIGLPVVGVDCRVTVAIPETADFTVSLTNVPAPITINVTVFVAVVIVLFKSSHILDVINEVETPSATMLSGFAVFMIFEAPQAVADDVICTVPWSRLDDVAVTVPVPTVILDSKFIVAIPFIAVFVVVPNKLPSPVTENVSVFIPVVTVLLLLSHILAVIKEVAAPSAGIHVGFAVLMSFAGEPNVVVTCTVPDGVKLAPVVVTVAVPGVVVERNIIVAIPDIAFFVVVPSKVPCPDTVNVSMFVAVVIV